MPGSSGRIGNDGRRSVRRSSRLRWARSSPGPLLGEQLVGTGPAGVPVGNGRNDQLVGFSCVAEPLQLVRDLARGAGELGVDAVGDQLAVSVAPDVAASLPGGGELDGAFGGADAAHPQA